MNSDKEYMEIVKEILESEEFQKRKEYCHHENESVYDHCLEVSYLAYRLAKKFGYDYKSAAIGGLLHDFYPYPWQYTEEQRIRFEIPKPPRNILKKHGFVHAREAYQNAKKYYPEQMNPKVKNMILRHMFPLNIHPPRYAESWIVTAADKYVSARVFKHPTKYYKYVGIPKIGKKKKK